MPIEPNVFDDGKLVLDSIRLFARYPDDPVVMRLAEQRKNLYFERLKRRRETNTDGEG